MVGSDSITQQGTDLQSLTATPPADPPAGPNLAELLNVAEAVRLTPDEKFSLTPWRSVCGSIACSVGNYARHFPDKGLTIVSCPMTGRATPRVVGADGEALFGWPAVRFHFGLSLHDAERLFLRINYVDARDRRAVIHRIEQFVADYRPGAAPFDLYPGL